MIYADLHQPKLFSWGTTIKCALDLSAKTAVSKSKQITVTEKSIIRDSPERTTSYPCTGSCVSKFLTLVLPYRMHSGLFNYRNDTYEKLSLVQGQITMRGILFGYSSLKSSLPKDQTPFLLYCVFLLNRTATKRPWSRTLIIS